MLLRSVSALIGTHLGLSVGSMAVGAGGSTPSADARAPDEVGPGGQHCATCSRAAQLAKTAAQMYRGGGIDAAVLSPGVVFEDPAVRCVGSTEVREAFRALRSCRPEALVAPRMVLEGDGSATAVFALHQRYLGFLEVRSTLHLHTAPDGRISRIEERWNGVPLVSAPPFVWSRRLNGMLSSALTPILMG